MSQDAPTQVAHIVLFTLKDRTDEARQKLLASCEEHLSGHDGVVYYSAGARGPEFDRPVNDDQYDVALHVVFESRAAHDAYQQHERHQQFLAENKQDWAQIRVFDSWV